MADIFLSYSREDRSRAGRVVELLETQGWTVFWDCRLNAGTHFRQVIRRELDDAKCIVVLWSKSSIESDWVSDEAEEGKKRRSLLSVLLDDVEPPLGFRQLQTAPLFDWSGDINDRQVPGLLEGVRFLITHGKDMGASLPPEPRIQSAPLTPKAPRKRAARSASRLPKNEPEPVASIPLQAEVPPAPSAPAPSAQTSQPGTRIAVVAPIAMPPDAAAAPQLIPNSVRGTAGRIRIPEQYAHLKEPALLLGVVFLLNLLQTKWDWLFTPSALGPRAGYPIADAFRWFEGYASFEGHEVTSMAAVRLASIAYFFLHPAMMIGMAAAFAASKNKRQFKAFSLSVAMAYAISLPFFLFFPVPERWAFPETEAVLLSDLWSDNLIEAMRPLSGLDNCFPSFHVATSTLMIALAFLYAFPLRTAFLCVGVAVIASTFVLGIHWSADITAGIALGAGCAMFSHRYVQGQATESVA